jgi:putative FmdB family regulatory protein
MPTYAYRCTACSHEFEVFQKFSEAALTECPECASPIRKVFQPVGIVFKGSGWYINDSRKPESGSTTNSSESTAKAAVSETKAATPATETSSTPAPAPAKAAAD